MEIPLLGEMLDGFAVATVMLRPSEDPRPQLERCVLAVWREAALAALDDDPVSNGGWVPAELLRAESMTAWRQSIALGNRLNPGWVAGEMLLHLLCMAEHAPEHATVNKACFLVLRDLADARLYSGSKAPCSRKTIWDAWSEFRPAAHLWASFTLTLDGCHDLEAARGRLEAANSPPLPAPGGSRPVGLFPKLVPVAEALRRLAEGYKIPAAGDMWSVPARIILPPVDVTIPPPTDWALEQLRNYRAK
jgi:hypothetical protein